MKYKLVIIFLCCLGVSGAYSQTTSNIDSFRTKLYGNFSDFRKKTLNDYERFRNEINKTYSDFLRRPWIEELIVEGDTIKEKELVVPPVIYEGHVDAKPSPTPIDAMPVTIPEEQIKQPSPVVPIEVSPSVQSHKTMDFTLYGTNMCVHVPKKNKASVSFFDIDEVANAWNEYANGDWDTTLKDCLELREKYNLCDWAYLQMLKAMVARLNLPDKNSSTLLLSYLYSNSGYKMRLARGSSRLYLLLASRHQIYDWSYYLIDGEKYYPLDCDEDNLYISKAEFPNEQPLSLLVIKEQNIALKESASRRLESKKGIVISCQINENLLDFYNTFPTSSISGNHVTRWAIYANTPLSSYVRNVIYPQLRSQIEHLSEKEKVSNLLNFVQTAFVYEYDSKVWGDDRAFFAEETLFYPFCDCEDRSILFSHLVRELVGLEVALVYYPGHLATAVHFKSNVCGDYIIIDGNRYVICDPTYINAPIGLSMPNLDKSAIQTVVLK